MRDDGGATMQLGHGAETDGESEVDGLALAQAHVAGFDEHARGAEIARAAETVMAPGQAVDIADLPPDIRIGDAPATVLSEGDWRQALCREVASRLARGERGIAESLTRDFESALIGRAMQILRPTLGRRHATRIGSSA